MVRYLKSKSTLGLKYFKKDSDKMKEVDLDDFTDGSLGNAKNRRSVSGFVMFLSYKPLCFKTVTKKEVSLSTSESEIIGLSHLTANMS